MIALKKWLADWLFGFGEPVEDGYVPPVVAKPEQPVTDPATDDGPSLWFVWEENARRLFWGEQAVRATNRPCWACGDPAGFHVEHRPCWNVAPFSRTAPTLPDGTLLNPTRRAG